ncbi:MAG: lipoyl(octanoyl) transferase LipB [Flavobacteriaceae bacterium]|nr:lipoyl(octanoyl) transferase LipB [Flavobacteriaceae bacterium]
MKQNKIIKVSNLGKNQDYRQIWAQQEKLLESIAQIKMEKRKLEKLQAVSTENHATYNQLLTPNYLLLVEHPHVYTLGKSGHEENMLANSQKLQEIQATFVRTNRGGDITYHGPGQLVAYPVLDLANFKEDINWYMRSLEEVIIRTIANYGLKGERSKGETGVWLDTGKPWARKICALGVKASRWITMHGLALNVNSNLRYFEYIIPCGITDKAVTSLQRELDREVSMKEVHTYFLKYFAEVFEAELDTDLV